MSHSSPREPDRSVMTHPTFPHDRTYLAYVDEFVPYRVGPLRRALDVLVVLLSAPLVVPVLTIAMLAVLVRSGRPVLFISERVGEGGRPFRFYKLRTMTTGPAGAGVTAAGDPRITGVGRFLRRTSLDELPQLWHVLRGQMTLVGPRPESARLASRYPHACRPVLLARPGLTGPTQLEFRESSIAPPPGWDVERWYLTALVPLRVAKDMEFLENPTIGRTAYYIVRTAAQIVG